MIPPARLNNEKEKGTEFEHLMNIMLLGETGVGKTSLMRKYVDREFSEHMLSTIGIDFECKILEIEGTVFKVRIWDTAGQERFRSIPVQYFHRTNGFALVYSSDNPRSLELLQNWFSQIEEHCPSDVPIMILGNKYDLSSDLIKVPYEEANEFAVTKGLRIFRVSARTGLHIDDSFDYLINEVYRKSFSHLKVVQQSKGVNLSGNSKNSAKKACCSKT
eukprot:TRINITY_DN7801_c0_g1_i2.p1 TRINITY_DN7801_c0_g1~~TRINITY_DN7801_c0_g1_i2.p1  ORF type:complete len:218 (-),score=32.24 TRINITY_DN7801_c0_g1_i2:98-751(-)